MTSFDGSVMVDPGDPHNDQMLAATAEDLKKIMLRVREVLDQAEEVDAPLAAVMAGIVTLWLAHEEIMHRERLASLLALSLVQHHAYALATKDKLPEWAEFFRRMAE